MSIELKFFERTVYGNILFYPANEQASCIVNLAKRATFNLNELKKLKGAGFTVIIERESSTL